MSQRKVDRVAVLAPVSRGAAKWGLPDDLALASKDNGTGPGRLPDDETVKGAEYEAAAEREAEARLCVVCKKQERRHRLALRCEGCEQRHLESVRMAQERRKGRK